MTSAHRFVAAIILLSLALGAFVTGRSILTVWTLISLVVAVFLLVGTLRRRDRSAGK
jgi:hypothetical protein